MLLAVKRFDQQDYWPQTLKLPLEGYKSELEYSVYFMFHFTVYKNKKSSYE